MRVKENSLFQKGLRIIINWDLYQKLLFGELKKPPEKELEIETTDGPIDGILGTYEGGKGRATIDIKEIGLSSFFSGKVTNQEIDDGMTKTLAHEGRHYTQHMNLGNLRDLDKLIFVGIILIFFVGTLFLGLYMGFKMPHLLNKYFGWTFAGLNLFSLYIVYYLVVFRAIAHIQFKFFRIALALGCWLSWGERNARKFAEKAKKDKRWDDVVKIE